VIYIIREGATPEQIKDMLQMLQTYIKLAVDVDRGILAAVGQCTQIVKPFYWMMAVNRSLFGEPIGIHLPNK
jgi:hypothetical protein